MPSVDVILEWEEEDEDEEDEADLEQIADTLWLFFKVSFEDSVQQHSLLSSSTLNFLFLVEVFKVYALDRVRQCLLPLPAGEEKEEKEEETWPHSCSSSKVGNIPVVTQR